MLLRIRQGHDPAGREGPPPVPPLRPAAQLLRALPARRPPRRRPGRALGPPPGLQLLRALSAPREPLWALQAGEVVQEGHCGSCGRLEGS
uniref:Uncharacterized protein n=1 Tax=Arcella intermedia TaxID=1963864 RepID=A0A6B2LN80_9EUKA